MSSYCDEAADVYNETHRRARKEHECCACHRTIKPGETYTRLFVAFDNETRHYIRCVGCQTIHEHLRTLGDGEMWPDERLDCGEEYTDHWGKEPPELIAALAFASPNEAKRIAALWRLQMASHNWFKYNAYLYRRAVA